MNETIKNLNLALSIISSLIAIIGLIQKNFLLITLGASLFLILLAGLFYMHYLRIHIKKANLVIEGIRIDSLNLANLSRSKNNTLKIDSAKHTFRITNNDLKCTFEYSGICKAQEERGFVFSVDADKLIPFEDLKCYGYDLKYDPQKDHKIKPVLEAPDGLSKKIKLPFSRILRQNENFHIELINLMQGCMNYGKDYCFSTLSFSKRVNNYSVRLEFENIFPKYLRVYDLEGTKEKLICELLPKIKTDSLWVFEDIVQPSAISVRIYVFFREKHERRVPNDSIV